MSGLIRENFSDELIKGKTLADFDHLMTDYRHFIIDLRIRVL